MTKPAPRKKPAQRSRKKKAEPQSIEQVAEDNAAESARLTLPERYERLQKLVSQRLSFPNRTWEEIAASVELSVPQCKALWRDWCEHDKANLRNEDPEAVIHEHIAGFRLLREQAAELATRASTAENVILGCYKLIADLRSNEISLRQQTGFLPKELGRIRHDVDVRFILDKVIDVLQRHKVPRSEIEELANTLGDRARMRAGG